MKLALSDFDRVIERRRTDSEKWWEYGPDVLPMWVADMDFPAPEPVIEALRQRVEHGVFGYAAPPGELAAVICERMQRLYKWTVKTEEIVFLPGVVSGLGVVCRGLAKPGDGVLIQPPVYPPFLKVPGNHGLTLEMAGLSLVHDGSTMHYEVDCERFETAIRSSTRLFILCHPHNPTGREYSRRELTQMAEVCLRHDMVICSDEIHCDVLLDGTEHTPMAALSPDIASRCVTLMAPSKTFNVPGLGCSFAIVQNAELRERLERAAAGIIPHVNVLGLTAALAAYRDGDEWLALLRQYLTANRDALMAYVGQNLPGVVTTCAQATYLAWLDCREAGLGVNPHEFFLQHARVAVNDGAAFGPGGEGFVRLNFGCPRSVLMEGLGRMGAALRGRRQ